MKFNKEDIRNTYKFLAHEEETEIRLINPNTSESRVNHVNNEEDFVKICTENNGKFNIYAGINERISGGTLAKDVKSVKTIVIDIDPKRAPSTASTDKELEEANRVACQVEYDMLGMGFEQPRMAMSGNGYQMWFAIPKIEITNDTRKIFEDKIKALNKWFIERYGNATVSIDNIGDLPRIIKVIGTISIKGKPSEERPHRVSKWVKKSDRVEDENLKLFAIQLENEMKKVVREVNFTEISEENWASLLKNDKKLKDLMDGKWEEYYPPSQGKSRSEAEMGLVEKLVSYKLPKEQIFSLMSICGIGKWQGKPNSYKDRTYEKAVEYYKTSPHKGLVDDIDDNIEWNNDNIKIIYYIGDKASKDEVEVYTGDKISLSRVKWNLRDNYAQQQKFLKKYKGQIDEKDLLEITQKILSSSVCSVNGVSLIKEKNKKNNTYEVTDQSTSVDLIHPALDFTEDEMYVGVDAMSKDSENVLAMRHFILTNSSELIAVPNLEEHNIQLIRDPMVIQKKIFSLPLDITPQTLQTHQDLKECYKAVNTQISHFIDLEDKRAVSFVALWVLGTYTYKLFNAFPYITLFGYKATGKTKMMDLCSFMSFNGQKSVGISAPALFRGTDGLSWSLFFDESGLLRNIEKGGKSKRADEIAPIILTGYKKGGIVPRIGSKESGFALEFYQTYCPKMFASTEEMDEILESRSVQIVMRPADKATGKGEREPDEFKPIWTEIRTNILFATLKEWRNIKESYHNLENKTELGNREWEICKPICAIAKQVLDDEEYKDLTDYFVETFSRKKSEVNEKTDFEIIKALVRMDAWDVRLTIDQILTEITTRLRGGMRPDWLNNKWFGRRVKKLIFKIESGAVSGKKWYLFKKEEVYKSADRFGIDIEEEIPEPKMKKIPSDKLNMGAFGEYQ